LLYSIILSGKRVRSVDESERINEEIMKYVENCLNKKLGIAFYAYRDIIKFMEA
jgi:hypothetical protein